MSGPIRPASLQDLLRWPDGCVCFREDLHHYDYRGDDYEVITEENPEWELLIEYA